MYYNIIVLLSKEQKTNYLLDYHTQREYLWIIFLIGRYLIGVTTTCMVDPNKLNYLFMFTNLQSIRWCNSPEPLMNINVCIFLMQLNDFKCQLDIIVLCCYYSIILCYSKTSRTNLGPDIVISHTRNIYRYVYLYWQ